VNDSLLEIISDTQSSSVTKVSPRNCELITDNGFSCLQGKRIFGNVSGNNANLENLDVVP
ncbi:45826_t:CDS:2, partial [Gigaspora margarita]